MAFLLLFWFFGFAEYNKYYDAEIASTSKLKKIIPNAAKELDALIVSERGLQAGANDNNKAAVIKYSEDLVLDLISLIPKLSKYPNVEGVLLYNIVMVLKLIRGLLSGIATIQDVNEFNKKFAIILENVVPK